MHGRIEHRRHASGQVRQTAGQIRHGTSRARDNREVRTIQNVRIVLPRADLDERVRANQEKQLEGGEPAVVKAAQGQSRIRRCVMDELDIRGLPSGSARDCQGGHRKPVIGGGDGLRPVRRNVRRDDEHLRQAEGGLARTGQVDVPAMNRVEGAAKNPDASRGRALGA